MSRLEELILKYCPEGVIYKKLKDVSEMRRGTSITKKDIIEGNIPVISGGKVPAYYCNQYNREGQTITVAGSGAGAGYIQYWEKPIFACDSFSIKGNDSIVTKYLYYFLTNHQEYIYSKKKGSGVPHVHISSIENMLIPVPPLKVQNEIVRVLDTFTELTEKVIMELTNELEARKKQYDIYREKMLELNSGFNNYKLKDICNIYLGLTATPKYVNKGIKFISAQNISQDYLDLTNVKYISEETYKKASSNAKPKRGDLLFTRVGSNLGHPVIVNTDEELCMFVSLGFLRVKDKNQVSANYLKHWMNTRLFWEQVRNKTYGSAKVNLNTGWLNEFDISLPDFETQLKIIEILDSFESLCKDISAGLSAEIKLRQQQYEYYRDKLLTFKPKK